MAEQWSASRRDELAEWLNGEPGVPWRVVGDYFGVHRSTVQREVDRNGGRDRYRPASAQRAAERARRRPRTRILERPGPLRDRVTAELALGRSPEAIWADLRVEEAPVVPCVETIYTAVYAGVLDVNPRECLRRRRPRRRPRRARHSPKRLELPNIGARPDRVNDREELGHWEADHMIGWRNQSGLMALSERVTRYAMLITMPEGYGADAALAGLCEAFDRIPAHLRRSVTFDLGSEWARWQTLADTFDLDVWFCNPHAPWERGQIENQNGHWRFWFPRGTRLDDIDPDHADAVAELINNQRRRSLDYQSPASLYAAASAH